MRSKNLRQISRTQLFKGLDVGFYMRGCTQGLRASIFGDPLAVDFPPHRLPATLATPHPFVDEDGRRRVSEIPLPRPARRKT